MKNRKKNEDLENYLRKLCFDEFEYIKKKIDEYSALPPEYMDIIKPLRYSRSYFFLCIYRARIITFKEYESIVSVVDPEFYEIVLREIELYKRIEEEKNATLQRKEEN